MSLTSNDIIIEPDLRVSNGDISIEVSDDRNIEYIVYADAGQIRKAPTLGVSIVNFINGPTEDGRNIRKTIRKELEKDGYSLKQIDSEEKDEGVVDVKIKANKITSKL